MLRQEETQELRKDVLGVTWRNAEKLPAPRGTVKTTFKVLDVGCGSRPKGDVNVDLRSPKYVDPKKHFYLDPKRMRNFVRASAEYLPFRDSVFSSVVSFHVIEHVENPIGMLNETIRVSSSNVVIKCPHRMSQHPLQRSPWHRNFFNKTWFRNFLSEHKKVKGSHITITGWKPFPSYLLSLCNFPSEITVEIFVG
ncbi:MAG: class I SAM-dependent methyltransferase [Candidatus Bathyarchaeia archaeon]